MKETPPSTCYFRTLCQMLKFVCVYLLFALHASNGEPLNEGMNARASLTTRRHRNRQEGESSGTRAPTLLMFFPAIDLSYANPARGHKEVRRSTDNIMVTTRYSDQQGSKSRQDPYQVYSTENIGNLSASRRCLWVRTTVSTIRSDASISESELHAATKNTV